MKRSLQLLLVLFSSLAADAQITLLKDINGTATTSGSNPTNFIVFGSYAYYSASDGVTGTELWRTDGTAAGTTQVKDINPGDGNSSPNRFTIVGSYLYFTANDGETGVELWRTDGTPAGTVLVADINPGSANSSPNYLVAVGTTSLYFRASSAATGTEIYKSDVSGLSATLIKDINSTAAGASSSPAYLVYVSGTTVYFSANDGTAGAELWKTDGTDIGTQLIKNINPNASAGSNPAELTLIGTTVVFSANDGTNGVEVWSCTNGTSAGTNMISNINITAGASSYPGGFTKYGSHLYFYADDGGFYGQETYRTDGTAAQTFIMFNTASTANIGSNPYEFTVVGSNLYFTANDGTNGTELWKYTGSGLPVLYNINLTAGTGSNPYGLRSAGGLLYFQANTTAAGYEMYKMNGTTVTLIDLLSGAGSSSPYEFTQLGSNVIFNADAGAGSELWKYDGTNATQIVDLISGTGSGDPFDYTYNNVTPNGTVFFTATNGSSGYELWKTDGTTVGTVMVKDINPGMGDSYPSYITVVGNYVFFAASDGTDNELWRSDGTSAGTVKLDIYAGANSSFPSNLVALNSTTLVLRAQEPVYGSELYKVVGTGAPTVVNICSTPSVSTPSSPSNFTVIGTTAYFSANDGLTGVELWKYDGTTATRISDIATGTLSSYPYGMKGLGSTVYFQAANDGSGSNGELFKTTGTLASTALVKDINPGAVGSYPSEFYPYNGFMYFNANDGTNGYELWRTDGTLAGTTMLKDIFTGSNSGSPTGFIEYNAKLYFAARTLAEGYELWQTDGTGAGTVLYKDLNPGQPNGGFSLPIIVGSNMYFLGSDGSGSRIWVTDGRSCATITVPSFAGAATSSAQEIAAATFGGQQKIVFTMNAKGYEREPFLLDPSGISLPVAANISAQPAPTQSVLIGASASFSVTATGTGLTYQWQKNSVNIPGATSATYNIAATADTDAATYRVIVTGTCGQVTSANSVLTVNATTPVAQPTALVFSNPTPTTLTISFTAASGSPTGYLVLRKKGSAPTEVPVDGTSYTAGATLGTSVVVKANALISGTDTGLDNNSEYFYTVFSFNGGGSLVKYLTTSPLAGSGFTTAPEPLAQPTALVFSNVDGTTLTGSFTGEATATRYLVIRTPDAAPTGVPADGKVYNVGETIGDATVAYLGDVTTFNDSGLTPEKPYFYQVFSARGPASTVNYLTASPLQGAVSTLATTPEAPTAFKFTNVTTSSFTVSFTAPANAPAGYLVLRNQGTSITAVPVDGTTYTVGQTVGDGRVAYLGTSTTFDETLPLLPYSYVVYPFNGSGALINYRTVTPLTGFIGPDDSAPVITDNTVATIAAQAPLKITATVAEPQSGIQSVTVDYLSIAKGGARTVKDMVLVGGNYEYTIPAGEINELGIEYIISATNTLNLKSTKAGKTALTITDQSISMTGGEDVTNYRIISIPFDLSSKTVKDIFGDDYGDYNGIDYRMYRYDNGATNELNANSLIEVGKGYWLIVKTSKAFDTGAGATTPVTSTTPFTIELKAGWNQIGNPYNFNVLWGDVTNASGVNLSLRVYNGGFGNSNVLNKYQGGFVFANNAATLKFPTQYNGTAGREITDIPKLENSIDQRNWEVMFNVRNGKTTNIFSGFGMNEKANVLFDEYDDFTLPRFLSYVEVNHNKKVRNASVTKDVVPSSINHTWEFTVEAQNDGVTEITWNNSYFGLNDRNLLLWDEEESIAIDMRETTSYSFYQTGARKFKAFYGDKTYVNEKASADQVRIHTVSPNPSEGDVNVTFTIPGTEQSFVEVKIFNALGQPVSSLHRGTLSGGIHTMNWNGRDVNGIRPSQGVYLVEVISNGQRIAKRVVLK